MTKRTRAIALTLTLLAGIALGYGYREVTEGGASRSDPVRGGSPVPAR